MFAFSLINCDLLEEEETDDVGSSDLCIVGSWSRIICGGNEEAIIVFRNNNTGFFNDYDCNLGCVRRFDFNWTLSGDSSVTLNYTSSIICGEAAPIPTGGTQSYQCSGNTLTVGNTYTRL